MIFSIRCIFLAGVVLLIATAGSGLAQQRTNLPVQQHKILWADTVHRQAIQKKDSLLLAEAYYLYGKVYESVSDLLTSKRWFLKSLAILEPRGNSFNLSRLYFRLAGNELTMRNYAETRRYAQLSLAIAQQIKDTQALTRAYSRMCDFYKVDWSRGGKRPELPAPKPDSSNYYWQMNETLIEANSHIDSLVNLEFHLLSGHKLWNEKRDTNSIAFFKKALNLAIQKNEPTWQFRIMNEMANMYIVMGKHQQAWKMIQDAKRFHQNSFFKDSYGDQVNFERTYRDYYVAIGDWRRAYEHTEKKHDLERSNYAADRDGAVTRLSLEYETERKEALLKEQEKQLSLRNENLRVNQLFLWTLSALLVLAFGAIVVFYRLYRKKQRISQQNAMLVSEQNHRVKNNLQVVSSLLNLQANRLEDENAKKSIQESQRRIETMAILHRRLYDTDTLGQVDLSDFVPELVDSVMQASGCSHVQSTYELDSVCLLADNALLVGLILNELTTNACKYAFSDHADPIFRVSCQQYGKHIHMVVSDNGPGLNSATLLAKPHSFGMRLIQMLTRQLRGTYQFATNEGTLFRLEFTTS